MIFQGHQNHSQNQNSRDHQFIDVQSMLCFHGNLTIKTLTTQVKKNCFPFQISLRKHVQNTFCLGGPNSNICIATLKRRKEIYQKLAIYNQKNDQDTKIIVLQSNLLIAFIFSVHFLFINFWVKW